MGRLGRTGRIRKRKRKQPPIPRLSTLALKVVHEQHSYRVIKRAFVSSGRMRKKFYKENGLDTECLKSRQRDGQQGRALCPH